MANDDDIPYDLVANGGVSGSSDQNYGYHITLRRGGNSYSSIEEFLNALVDYDQLIHMTKLVMDIQAKLSDQFVPTGGDYLAGLAPIIEIWELKATQDPGVMTLDAALCEIDQLFKQAATEIPKQFKRLALLEPYSVNVLAEQGGTYTGVVFNYKGHISLKGISPKDKRGYYWSDEDQVDAQKRTYLYYSIRNYTDPSSQYFELLGSGRMYTNLFVYGGDEV